MQFCFAETCIKEYVPLLIRNDTEMKFSEKETETVSYDKTTISCNLNSALIKMGQQIRENDIAYIVCTDDGNVM